MKVTRVTEEWWRLLELMPNSGNLALAQRLQEEVDRLTRESKFDIGGKVTIDLRGELPNRPDPHKQIYVSISYERPVPIEQAMKEMAYIPEVCSNVLSDGKGKRIITSYGTADVSVSGLTFDKELYVSDRVEKVANWGGWGWGPIKQGKGCMVAWFNKLYNTREEAEREFEDFAEVLSVEGVSVLYNISIHSTERVQGFPDTGNIALDARVLDRDPKVVIRKTLGTFDEGEINGFVERVRKLNRRYLVYDPSSNCSSDMRVSLLHPSVTYREKTSVSLAFPISVSGKQYVVYNEGFEV